MIDSISIDQFKPVYTFSILELLQLYLMGKRKRDNKTPPPPEITPYAPHEVLQLEQSSGQTESSTRLSIRDVTGSSLKKPPGHQSPINQNQGPNPSILSRNARHTIGRHYSRRSSSTSHCYASPSKWSGTHLDDSKLSFRLSGKDHLSDLHFRETRDVLFHKPERIRSSSSLLSGNMRKIECGICQKRLQKKPLILDDSIPAIDVSVVAVLVCGHAYHADCLELKTSHQDKQDPSCPLCLS